MICLTGDVHQMSMKGADQKYLKGTEVDACLRYVEIARKHGLKATLFFTGKSLMEESTKLLGLKDDDNVELAGHTFSAFCPRLPYKISYRILGLNNGPYFIQRRQIRRTINTFRELLGYEIQSWRDHAYRHDRNTARLLITNGIKFFSDLANPAYSSPFKNDDLVYVPINILPDHDYIYHGGRQLGTFDEDVLEKSAFKTRAMSIGMWLDVVKKQVKEKMKLRGVATILAHPACMEIADDFKTFEQLCQFLAQFKSACMKGL